MAGQIDPDGTRIAVQANADGRGPVSVRERIMAKQALLAGE